jgi:hypothetical protein
MFYKCRLNFRQTGMIFGENAMKITNLEVERLFRRVRPRLTDYEGWA